MADEIMRISDLTDNSPIVIRTGRRSIALSVNDVRRWLGAETAPDHEVMKFLMQCQARRIDPFLKEAHLFEIKAGQWVSVVDISGWIEVAERHPQYDGHECGLVIQQFTPARAATKTSPAQPATYGEIRNIDETIRPEGYHAIGGWCRVHRKDRKIPTYRAVSMSEYQKDNRQWKSMALTMIVKTAVVHALAASGIVSRSGGYIPEELPGPGGDSDEADGTIDVEIEEDDRPAALPPKDDARNEAGAAGDGYPDDIDAPGLSLETANEVRMAVARSGLTDYQTRAMLARRGVERIEDLSYRDAREIVSKLTFAWEQEHAGEILLPDPVPDEETTREDAEGIAEGVAEITPEGDIIDAGGEVIGSVGDPDATAEALRAAQIDQRDSGFARMLADAKGFKLTANGHMLHTSKSHGCDPDVKCPICDGGLNVCAVCGAAEIELNDPCPGENRSPSDPPEGAAIQRATDLEDAYQRWRRANERRDIQVAIGIKEGIREAYGEQAYANWDDRLEADLAGDQIATEMAGPAAEPSESTDPADEFTIGDATRREERPAPPKRSRKKGGTGS